MTTLARKPPIRILLSTAMFAVIALGLFGPTGSAASHAHNRTQTILSTPPGYVEPLGTAHKTVRLTAGDNGPYLSLSDLLAHPVVLPRSTIPHVRPPAHYPENLKTIPIAQRAYEPETIDYLAKHEIRVGDRQKPLVALTFDCEAGTTSTRQILQTLRENNAHATFFILGKYACMYPEIIREMVTDGHELGNHSFFHPLFYDITPITATLEITMTEAAVDWAVGRHVPMRYFRFPYAGSSPYWRQFIAEWGYQSAFWGPDPRGWAPDKTPEDVIAYVRNVVRNGDIVIMHCHAWNDVHALNEVIHLLREKGLEPTTLTEILQDADRNVPGYVSPGVSPP